MIELVATFLTGMWFGWALIAAAYATSLYRADKRRKDWHEDIARIHARHDKEAS